MIELISIPLKKPCEVDIIKPLQNVLNSTTHQNQVQIDHSDSVLALSNLRKNALWRAFEKHESSLEAMYRYYDQICMLEKKIQVNELQIPFKWKDAFDRSIFGGKLSLTMCSLSYERICVLFNIAALQSWIAASQKLDDDEGLKLSAKLFQQSAGIFSHLKSHIILEIQQEPTPDMSPETLEALSMIMLAQAQEIFTHKAIHDNMKDSIVAKLAAQTEEYYSDVLRILQKEIFRAFWDKEWIPLISSKQLSYRGLSEYYQSQVCRNRKEVGEEITRLELAVKMFNESQIKSSKLPFTKVYCIRTSHRLDEITKDNDFIYHERIPDHKDVPPISKANVAKPLAIPEKLSCDFEDLFPGVLPASAHRIISKFEARKREVMNSEIARLRNTTQILNGTLASLNLPAAIEDTSGIEIPNSLLEKIHHANNLGGIHSLEAIMKELPESLKRNTDILTESEKILDEEQASDENLRSRFGEKWTRLPSSRLNEQLRINIHKYRGIINNAIQADKIVRDKLEKHRRAMTYLTMDPQALNSLIPDGSAVQDGPVVNTLKEILKKIDLLKSEGETLEAEVKSFTPSAENLLSANDDRGNKYDNDDILISQHIETTFGTLRERIDSFIRCSEDIIELVKVKHAEFASKQSSHGSAREKMLRELAIAYDIFTELNNNVQEGVQFYNDLTQLLIVLQNKISDFCFARKTEKEELLKDLTSRLSTIHLTTFDASSPNASSHSQNENVKDAQNLPYPVESASNMPTPFSTVRRSIHSDYMHLPLPQAFNPYSTIPHNIDGAADPAKYQWNPVQTIPEQ